MRPALRTQELLEIFFGMADDASLNAGGLRRLVFLSGILREFRDEFRVSRPPGAVQWMLIQTLGRLGVRRRRASLRRTQEQV